MNNSNLACTDSVIVGDIMAWIDRISTPDERIGGFAVCPFARAAKAKVKIYTADTVKDLGELGNDFEVIVIVMPQALTQDDLEQECSWANNVYTELVFLPDHKSRDTYIGAAQTNNGKHNLILCQPKAKLKEARKKLYKSGYYKFWDQEYLEEILGDDIVNLD